MLDPRVTAIEEALGLLDAGTGSSEPPEYNAAREALASLAADLADRQQLRDALKEALALIEDAFYPGPHESTADGIAVIENVRAALAASATP